MRPLLLGRWGSQIRPLGCRHCCPLAAAAVQGHSRAALRFSTSSLLQDAEQLQKKRGRPRKSNVVNIQSSMAAPAVSTVETFPSHPLDPQSDASSRLAQADALASLNQLAASPVILEHLPSPPPQAALQSAKLSALHARLSLPSQMPKETLARTLIHKSADPDARFNNSSLSVLGRDLLSYYSAENLLARYPRLPMLVLYAAQFAYVGPSTLAAMTTEWGVEAAAEPGGEVDAGLLQFKRAPPGTPVNGTASRHVNRRGEAVQYRRGITSRVLNDDEFGEAEGASAVVNTSGETLEGASASFVSALFGALYLHAGASTTKAFFKDHILSRHLDLSTLFVFTQPTRDLSRLCAREGFEAPVARLESETGRLSRHPVFVVGVYSGKDKLGEGAGSSLNEARFKAAAAALKGWYLYSPLNVVLPSEAGQSSKTFEPIMVDSGEIIA